MKSINWYACALQWGIAWMLTQRLQASCGPHPRGVYGGDLSGYVTLVKCISHPAATAEIGYP